jgi:Na+-transporting methylmalonyl-CoA/oxaloacetate decarboxylase gamma subunit
MNPETLALGVQTTIVGLGVVFIMLTVLWGVVTWLDKIVESLSQTPPPAGGGGGSQSAPVAAAPAASSAPAAGSGVLSARTIAAIMGAVSAVSGMSLDHLKFTAIQRERGPRLAWNEAGIAEIINTRQQFL